MDSTFYLDWDNIPYLKYTKPVSICIFGEKILVRSWAELWYQVCLICEEKQFPITSFSIPGRNRTIWSDSPDKLIKPHKLRHNGYVETNYSAKDMAELVKMFLMFFGVVLSSVKILVQRVQVQDLDTEIKTPLTKTITVSPIHSSDNEKAGNKSGLTKEEAEIFYEECIKQLHGRASAASVISKLTLKIDKEQNVITLARHQMMYLLSEGKFGLPCTDSVLREVYESHSKSVSNTKMITENRNVYGESYQENFYKWLSDKVPSSKFSDYYIAYSKIEEELRKTKKLDDSLFSVIDASFAESLSKAAMSNYKLKKMGWTSSAMRYYCQYIREKAATIDREQENTIAKEKTIIPLKVSHAQNTIMSDDIVTELRKRNIRYLDERHIGGHLWIFGYVVGFVRECRQYGVKFYSDIYIGGNKAFDKLDGWYTDGEFPDSNNKADIIKDKPPAIVQSNIERKSTANPDRAKYIELLKTDFSNGFKSNSAIEMRRFRELWRKKYNSENADSDMMITATISSVTISCGGKQYLPETMISDETSSKMLSYIDSTFSSGIRSIYYNALFENFSDELLESKISDAEMLKTYLYYALKDKYHFSSNSFSTEAGRETDPTDEVNNYLLDRGGICTKEQIYNSLCHIPSEKISQILAANGEFVRNAKGEYFHADIVDLNEKELENISGIIRESIEEKDFISDSELYEMIQKCYPSIAERYSYLSLMGFREALGYKLQERFYFQGKIISADKELSMAKVFGDFCRHNETVTLEQLEKLKDDLDTQIYYDAVYDNSLRVSETEFVSIDKADFDVSAVDAEIEKYFSREYVLLCEITSFMSFTYSGYMWNSYLLESYVYRYSKKFSLSHNSFGKNFTGAIVRKGSPLGDFRRLAAQALADSRVELTESNALNWLNENKLLAVKRFKDIGPVVSAAKEIRKTKG